MKCPACKAELGQHSSHCYACGRDWSRATLLDIGVVMALFGSVFAFWVGVWLLSVSFCLVMDARRDSLLYGGYANV
jgi:hypothetical protein